MILAAVARKEGAGWSPECARWILEVSLQVSGNLDKWGLPTRLQGPKGRSTMGSLSCFPHFQREASPPAWRSGWAVGRLGGPPPLGALKPEQVPEPL